MRLALRMGLSRPSGATAFTPASLAPVAWYDPSDLSTLKQNSNGTGAVTTDGDRVGYIADKSGNGNHAIQATAGSRATYKTAGGLHWLEFDGVDDYLSADIADLGSLAETIVGFRSITAPANGRIISGANIALFGATYLYMNQGAASLPATTISTGADFVCNCRLNGASSRINVNRGTYGTDATGPGAGAIADITLCADSTGASPTNTRIYGLILVSREMTASEIANSEDFMAAKSGVTLP